MPISNKGGKNWTRRVKRGRPLSSPADRPARSLSQQQTAEALRVQSGLTLVRKLGE